MVTVKNQMQSWSKYYHDENQIQDAPSDAALFRYYSDLEGRKKVSHLEFSDIYIQIW